MHFVGIIYIFCVGIIFEQQDVGMCLQEDRMHLYCTNRDENAIASNSATNHIRHGKSGPRGQRGPPGIVDYGQVNATIEERIQDTLVESRVKMDEMDSRFTAKLAAINAELSNERTKISIMDSMMNEKDEEISELRSEINDLKEILELNGITHPKTWFRASNNYRYKVFSNVLDYNSAVSNCAKYGATLASVGIRNATVFSELISLIQSSGDGRTWIGLDDKSVEGIYTWSDGVQASIYSVDWDEDQPNIYGGDQDCVEIWSNHQYRFNDEGCGATKISLCEIKIET